MNIPTYPEFVPISFDMQNEIEFYLRNLPDGISELTFMNFYLFKETYKYQVAKTDSLLIIIGEYKDKPFFITPCCLVNAEIIKQLLEKYKNWMILSKSFLEKNKPVFEQPYFQNLKIEEDRDNFDYIYRRKDLAELAGKDFHKKKTHINNFEKNYGNIKVKALTLETVEDAKKILEIWAASRTSNTPENSDYFAAKEALNILPRSALFGIVLYVDNKPVAWSLAEITNKGNTAVIIFEKADTNYKGSFQYINYAFAGYLPEHIEFINRQQDLGDAGLRQAKMTYRPVDFIKKYKISI